MKVIGAGLPRTATTTQTIVLEQLGFGPCYHMRDLLMDLEGGLTKWEAVAAGERPDWDAIFGDAQSTVDWPAGRYWRELMEAYPDAKVLLSVRDGQGWVKSMRETVWAMYFGDSTLRYLCAARGNLDPLWQRFLDLMTVMTWDSETGALAGDTFDDQGFVEAMERYNQTVIDAVPADRLLVWDPKEGWEPLCAFLEVDVPAGELPRANDTQGFREGIIGGALEAVNRWWDARDRPTSGLHGADLN